MNENQLRQLIKLESLKHLNKVAQVPNKAYDCFDCEQLINVVYRDLFQISIRKDGYGKSSTTKVLTSSIGNFYNFSKLNIEEKKKKIFQIQIGDILFFHTQSLDEQSPTKENWYPGHLGLYLGNQTFIHAKSSAGKVVISNLNEENYIDILVGYKNLIPYILDKLETEYLDTYKR